MEPGSTSSHDSETPTPLLETRSLDSSGSDTDCGDADVDRQHVQAMLAQACALQHKSDTQVCIALASCRAVAMQCASMMIDNFGSMLRHLPGVSIESCQR